MAILEHYGWQVEKYPIKPQFIDASFLGIRAFEDYETGIAAEHIIKLCQARNAWSVSMADFTRPETLQFAPGLKKLRRARFIVVRPEEPARCLITHAFVRKCFERCPAYRTMREILDDADRTARSLGR